MPEFPAAGVLMLLSAIAASLYLLRWRKQAIVPAPDGGSRMGMADYTAIYGPTGPARYVADRIVDKYKLH